MDSLARKVREIAATRSLLERALKLAGLVSSVFRDAGTDLVVVGGTAVEFYTEGAYMSGDIDLCRLGLAPVPLRRAQDLMARLGATGGPRSWKVAGLYVDLLGLFENEARTPLRRIETPHGRVEVMPAELALVERVLLACYPRPSPEARNVARKLMAVCIRGATPLDWDEVERLAALPSFAVTRELAILRKETEREIRRSS
jgi:hypothetical protein